MIVIEQQENTVQIIKSNDNQTVMDVLDFPWQMKLEFSQLCVNFLRIFHTYSS